MPSLGSVLAQIDLYERLLRLRRTSAMMIKPQELRELGMEKAEQQVNQKMRSMEKVCLRSSVSSRPVPESSEPEKVL